MRDRYHDAADAVLASSTAKLFMGPMTDDATRRYLGGALGEELREHDHHASWRPKAGPAELQQLERDRALLINGNLLPAVIRVTPYWELRDLKRLAAKSKRSDRWPPARAAAFAGLRQSSHATT